MNSANSDVTVSHCFRHRWTYQHDLHCHTWAGCSFCILSAALVSHLGFTSWPKFKANNISPFLMFCRFEFLSVRPAVKTNPPSHVRAMSEDSFPTSLLIHWTHPVPEEYITLIYQIRFCAQGSSDWDYVSLFLAQWKLAQPLQSCLPDLVREMCTFGSSSGSPWRHRQEHSVLQTAESSTRHPLRHSSSLPVLQRGPVLEWLEQERDQEDTRGPWVPPPHCFQDQQQFEKSVNKSLCLKTFLNIYSVCLCTDQCCWDHAVKVI